MKKALAITLLAICGGVTVGVTNQVSQNLTEVLADVPIEEYRLDAIMSVNAAFIDIEIKGNNKYYLSEINKIREDAILAISNSDSRDEISHIASEVIYEMDHFKKDEEVWEEFISNIFYPFNHYYYFESEFYAEIDNLEAFINDFYEKTGDSEKYSKGSNAIDNFRKYTDVVRNFTDLYKFFVTFDYGDISEMFFSFYETFFLRNVYCKNGFESDEKDGILNRFKLSEDYILDKATAYSEVMNYYMTFFDFELSTKDELYEYEMKTAYEYANHIATQTSVEQIINFKNITLNGMMKSQSEHAMLPRLKVLIDLIKTFKFNDEYKSYLEEYESLYKILFSETKLKIEDDYALFVIAKNSYDLLENYNGKFLAIKDAMSDNLWSKVVTELESIESLLSLLVSEKITYAESYLENLYQLVLAKIDAIDYIEDFAINNINYDYLKDYKVYEEDLDEIMYEVQSRIEELIDLPAVTSFVGHIVDQIKSLNSVFDTINDLESMFDDIRSFSSSKEYGELLTIYETKYSEAPDEVKEYSTVASFTSEFNTAVIAYELIREYIDETDEIFEINNFNDYQKKEYEDSIKCFIESLMFNLSAASLEEAKGIIKNEVEGIINISTLRNSYIAQATNARNDESFVTNKEDYDTLITNFKNEIYKINDSTEMQNLFDAFEDQLATIKSDNEIATDIINNFNQLPEVSFTVNYLSPLGNLYSDYKNANDIVKSLVGEEIGTKIVDKFEEARTLGIEIINQKVEMTLSYLSEENKVLLLSSQETAVDGLTKAINAKGMWNSYSAFMDIYNQLICELSNIFTNEVYSFYYGHLTEQGDVSIALDEISIVHNFYADLNAQNQDVKDSIATNTRAVGDELLTPSEMLSRLLMAYLLKVQETANNIKEIIDEIPNIITLSDEDTITHARELVNQTINADVIKILNDEGYFTKLEDAERKLEELKLEEQIKQEAIAIEALIDAIGEVTLESENAINYARNEYENASDEVKAIVELDGKLAILKAAERAFDDLSEKHELETLKNNAKSTLESYASQKDASKYDEIGLAAIADALSKGKELIENAENIEAVVFALGYAEAMIDSVPEYVAPVEPIKSGCGSSLIAASTIITLVSLLGAGLISIKKKRK